jgi:response regulator RpfG family c-di-GMP phosphodiesterase
VPATTGDQALRLLKTLHGDGVLLEYRLPDAAGSAIRAEIKRIRPHQLQNGSDAVGSENTERPLAVAKET